MESLGSWRIGARLALGFGMLIAMLIGMAGVAVRQTHEIYEALEYYTGNTTPSLKSVRDWQVQLDEIRLLQAKHLMANTESEMAAIEATIQQAAEQLQGDVLDYEQLLSNAEDRRLWQDVITAIDAAEADWDTLKGVSRLTLSDPAKAAEARGLFVGESEKLYKVALNAIGKEWDQNSDLAKRLAVDGKATFDRALILIAVVCALAVVIGSSAAVIIASSITRQLGGEPAHVVRIASAIAGGDLSVGISPRHGEKRSLVAAMRTMRDSLAEVVGQVRVSSETIATMSGQISSGYADLSQRTEEQAGKLQQTAASMEQLTGTVRSNAETARQACELATGASIAAAKGGELVVRVVGTMHDIAMSSRKVADITGVIDGIAFQTNILALNAAVEAAQAGEQGRGFAVVASEVRSLAQRAADAAREIKALVGDSVERVEVGARQVSEAGASMVEIVAQVKRVSQYLGDISNATSEQSAGIVQASYAIAQLDRVTQLNAALVEESAAAAESLYRQAARLAEVVGGFKVRQQIDVTKTRDSITCSALGPTTTGRV